MSMTDCPVSGRFQLIYTAWIDIRVNLKDSQSKSEIWHDHIQTFRKSAIFYSAAASWSLFILKQKLHVNTF